MQRTYSQTWTAWTVPLDAEPGTASTPPALSARRLVHVDVSCVSGGYYYDGGLSDVAPARHRDGTDALTCLARRGAAARAACGPGRVSSR